jgi:hypothetical protein
MYKGDDHQSTTCGIPGGKIIQIEKKVSENIFVFNKNIFGVG